MFGSEYDKFWKWFQKTEDRIFDRESDRASTFSELSTHLRCVHPDLVFEFSQVKQGRREFVISAGGMKAAFSAVTALVQAAPRLPRWQVVAFRQRKDVPDIRLGGRRVVGESLRFDYLANGMKKINLTLFIPGLAKASEEDRNELMSIGFLFLDAIVGEYDVETKLAEIDFVDAADDLGRRRLPLEDLPGIVDALPSSIQ
jgi:hypothetical protein